MNILMVLSGHAYPPDERVEREARDLIRDGHRLFLIARRGIGQAKEEDVKGVWVIRTSLPFQRKKRVGDLIYHTLQRYWIFFHIWWICRKHQIEALHVHDLPYAVAAVLVGKALKVPIVFDMHENYIVMHETLIMAKGYKFLKILYAGLMAVWRLEEKLVCHWAYRVIVVADEHVPRIKALGVAPDRIVIVTNTEDMDFFSGLSVEKRLLQKYQNDFIILFFGLFSSHRGLETAIEAMPRILEEIINAKLLLVGEGNNRRELEELVQKMNLGNKVIFTGFQPFKLIPTYIELSQIGLIPHISTLHIETTMPNKIFQFMLLGKPVVVSSVRPLKRVVKDAQCGLVFEERNPASLAEAVIKLRDKDLRRRLGENGRRAVKDRYNWQLTVQALLSIYRKDAIALIDRKQNAKG